MSQDTHMCLRDERDDVSSEVETTPFDALQEVLDKEIASSHVERKSFPFVDEVDAKVLFRAVSLSLPRLERLELRVRERRVANHKVFPSGVPKHRLEMCTNARLQRRQ